MEEKKEKGNFWLTVATFIVNKRKAFLVLFAIACIYCAACMNKVSVNQDITKYLPADSETRIGLTLMDEQFMTMAVPGSWCRILPGRTQMRWWKSWRR